MWVDIDGYDNYLINKNGEVKRKAAKFSPKERLIKPCVSTNGYIHFCLCKDGKPRMFRAHRLLAKAFIPNPENKPQVNHIDGDRKNNALSNLEWVTCSENHLHACRITKTRVPPRNMIGKFGEEHNVSKCFWIEYPDNRLVKYGSGLEFTRMTGFDHSAISWVRTNKNKTHKFTRGKMKGLIVHFEII